MSSSDQIKDLIRTGKKVGYILESDFKKCTSDLPKMDQEYSLLINRGKSLIVRYLARGETNKDGKCSVFFEINGQPRTIEIEDLNNS